MSARRGHARVLGTAVHPGMARSSDDFLRSAKPVTPLSLVQAASGRTRAAWGGGSSPMDRRSCGDALRRSLNATVPVQPQVRVVRVSGRPRQVVDDRVHDHGTDVACRVLAGQDRERLGFPASCPAHPWPGPGTTRRGRRLPRRRWPRRRPMPGGAAGSGRRRSCIEVIRVGQPSRAREHQSAAAGARLRVGNVAALRLVLRTQECSSGA